MELKEFIKDTLVQISKGIEEAKTELGQINKGITIINPDSIRGLTNVTLDNFQGKEAVKRIEEIEFDIAVIVEQKSEGKAGIGVLASIITAGASKSTGDINSETHRIKFKVPIKFA
jgi:hypothetical protein